MRSRTLFLVCFTLGHALLTVSLFLLAFRQALRAFETNEPPGPAAATIGVAAEVLRWPVVEPLVRWGPAWLFPGPLGYIPILANSLVWAAAALAVHALLRRRREAEEPA